MWQGSAAAADITISKHQLQICIGAKFSMEHNVELFEERSYVPNAANRMGRRSRAAALCARDYVCLKRVHDCLDSVVEASCRNLISPKKARKAFLQLAMLRMSLLLPKTIFCVVHRIPKNNTIVSYQGGDDDFWEVFRVSRANLVRIFNALRAPPLLRLEGDHAGQVSSEFAFIVWLYYNKTGATLMAMSIHFNVEYSRLDKFLHALEIWMFEEHGFRVTNAWHFWAPRVAEFNMHLRRMDLPPPAGFEQIWAVGIDATVVRSSFCVALLYCCINSKFTHRRRFLSPSPATCCTPGPWPMVFRWS